MSVAAGKRGGSLAGVPSVQRWGSLARAWPHASPPQPRRAGPQHHPHHHAGGREAHRWQQASQLPHGPAAAAAPAAGSGHAGEAQCPRRARATPFPVRSSSLQAAGHLPTRRSFCAQVRIQTVPASHLQQGTASGSSKAVSTVVVTTAPSPKQAPEQQ